MSNSPRRKEIKRRRLWAKRMRAAFLDPAMQAEWWSRTVAAQQRLIARRDPGAFDLLSIAKESLGYDSANDSGPIHS